MTHADPYAAVAAFYEAEYGQLEADVAFFSRHAGTGTLLVLGCGTGRVARRMASQRPVIGLDLSPTMLELARRLDPTTRFEVGDMRRFDVGPVGEIILPNGAFAFLPTRADQAACLQCCRQALTPGSQLTIDLPMPDFARWAERHGPERTAWEGRVHEVPARRTREVWRSLARQRLELLDRYYLDDALVLSSRLVLRVILPGELEWMLEGAGLYVEQLVGDYSGSPIGDDTPRIVARAVAI